VCDATGKDGPVFQTNFRLGLKKIGLTERAGNP
jgi:hypothetical protein